MCENYKSFHTLTHYFCGPRNLFKGRYYFFEIFRVRLVPGYEICIRMCDSFPNLDKERRNIIRRYGAN